MQSPCSPPRFVARLAAVVLVIGLTGLGLAVAQTPPAAMTVPLPAAQRLEAGDLIHIGVFEAPELTTEARLDAAGAITMLAAGRMELAGETASEAEQTIATSLRAHYLRAPQVTVLIREFAPQPVTVLGAVKDPGVYSARSFPNLESVLGAAGGLSALAGGQVLITGRGPTRTVAVDQLARGADTASIPVAGGDVVRVEPAATVYVGGDVRKPGAYPMPASGLSLVEALSLAGGVGANSRSSQTRLVQTAGDDARTTHMVNVQRILEGKDADVPIAPFDLIYVPHNGSRAFALRALETAVGLGTTIVSGVIIFH